MLEFTTEHTVTAHALVRKNAILHKTALAAKLTRNLSLVTAANRRTGEQHSDEGDGKTKSKQQNYPPTTFGEAGNGPLTQLSLHSKLGYQRRRGEQTFISPSLRPTGSQHPLLAANTLTRNRRTSSSVRQTSSLSFFGSKMCTREPASQHV